MKRNLLISAMALLAGSVIAADASPKEAVSAAAKQLAQAANYSWKTTVVVPEGSRFRPGPTDGKTEKDGFTVVTMSFGDNTTEMVLKGDKGTVKPADEDWQSLSDLEDAGGRDRFLAMMARNFKTPAAQAQELVSGAKDLKEADGVCSGDLTEAGAKSMLRFGPRRGNGPEISNAKGSVKFWVKDGTLSKYEFRVRGTVNFNDNERDIDRTTTVEIKDVGQTKVNVPDAAKQKLS
ncbi:MAG: hypothetical protein KGJ60_12820 [Verrucomicrobiota bacterium]|nr:hypothetical protein [Verrucomicrobiota bacterium]